jgi:DNA polymerase I
MALFTIPQRDDKETINKKAKSVEHSSGQKTSIIGDINASYRKIRELLENYKDSYKTITDLNELKDYVEKAIKDGYVSIDTETSGLNDISDKIIGFSLKSISQPGVYIPINHVSAYSKTRLDFQPTEKDVKPILQYLVDSTWSVWTNCAFDVGVLYWQVGVVVPEENILWDVGIAGHILNENEEIGLKKLYKKYIKNDEDVIFSYSDLFSTVELASVPIDIATIYAAHDAVMTESVFQFQYPYLCIENIEENNQYSGISYVYNYIDLKSIYTVVEMRNNGVRIDEKLAKELSLKYHNLLEDAQREYYEELDKYSDEINNFFRAKQLMLDPRISYSSPKQLSMLLYDILKIAPVDKKFPRGTGEEILEKINLPICSKILKCRGIEKLLNTYIEKLPKSVNQKTGKIHGRFNINGAVTGRFSSSEPNLQNIPSHNKEIRKMFIPDDGYVLVGSDYSQQEPRILAHMSGDENLQKAYHEGKDLYSWVASLVYKVPYEDCMEAYPDGSKNKKGAERRSSLKAVVLAIIYGKAQATVAEDLKISVKEANEIYDKFFSTFPKVREFIDKSQAFATKYGYVETAWGRKRRLPEMQLPQYEFSVVDGAVSNFDPLSFAKQEKLVITPQLERKYISLLGNARTFKKKSEIIEQAKKDGIIIKQNGIKIAEAERQCVNSRIQGSAADMVKLACINIRRSKEMQEIGFKLLMTVHDEIIGQVPIENAKMGGELLSKIMIETSMERINVPMKCDVEITSRWTGERIEL